MTIPSGLYFAFGSNLYEPQMRRRCPDCELLGAAVADGYRLGFFGRSRGWDFGGVATMHDDQRAQVFGAVYRLTEDDFRRLDNVETMYVRIRVEVSIDGGTRRAWAYQARSGAAPNYPSSTYLATMAYGYAAFGHPLDTLMEALRHLDHFFED